MLIPQELQLSQINGTGQKLWWSGPKGLNKKIRALGKLGFLSF